MKQQFNSPGVWELKKVMVVDDNPDQIFTINQILKNFDKEYDIISANSAKNCVQLLEKNEIPDLILLDIMMPEINGLELAKILKKNEVWKDIPIIFLTARSRTLAKTTGGGLGEDYIEKPFDTTDLIQRIEKIFRQSYDLKI